MPEDVRDKRGEGVRNGFQVSNLAIGWCHSQSLEIRLLKISRERALSSCRGKSPLWNVSQETVSRRGWYPVLPRRTSEREECCIAHACMPVGPSLVSRPLLPHHTHRHTFPGPFLLPGHMVHVLGLGPKPTLVTYRIERGP